MMFNMLTIGVYAIDNNANDIVLNRKEYALCLELKMRVITTEDRFILFIIEIYII